MGCRWLGHKVRRVGDSPVYGKIVRAEVDGMGVEHANVVTKCTRCGVLFTVIRIHMPKAQGTS